MTKKLNRRALLRMATGAATLRGINVMGVPRPEGGDSQSVRSHLPPMRTDLPWYRHRLLGIEVGPSGANDQDSIFYSRVSGKEIVKNLLKAKVEYAVIFMKDQSFAYYNSKIVRKCPGLGERDLLREILDEAREHGLPIVAYCQIQYDTSAWWAYPEWRMEDWDGNSIPSRLCYNSAYLDYNKRVAAEMMEYEIAGFHFDMLDFGFSPPYGCFCKTNCQPRFREEYKTEMPRPSKLAWDRDWEKILEFRANSNTHFCRELQAFVHAKKPEISVDFNYHGYPPFSWVEGELPVQHAMNGDFVTAEGLPWIFGYNNPSLLSLFLVGARLKGPTQVATSRSVYEYFDSTIRPVPDMLWEVSTYQAHGAQVTIVDKIRYDGTQDPLVYDRIGEVFGAARQKREYFGHPPVQEVGLYYSSRSRDWFAREEPMKYMQAFYGAHKALMEAHISMGMIMDGNLSPERLRDFAVAYVPNAAVLSEREIALFTRYVAEGGNLLITGLSGLYDTYGQPQKNSSLSELTGVRLIKTVLSAENNYLRLPSMPNQAESHVFFNQIQPNWPILTDGPMVVFESTSAQPFGELLAAYHTPHENPFGHMLSPKAPLGPALFISKHGKGKVLLVACSPDTAYAGNYRMPEHRYFIRNLIRYLNPDPPITIEAPLNVETVVTSDKAHKRLLVHLICFSSPPTSVAAPFGKGRRVLPPPMEQPMHYQATIKLNRSFVKAKATREHTRIARAQNQIKLATSEIYEVIAFDL